jgi:hypothetical protein
MQLSYVTDCVFQSDSFWGNANLNVLRMMVSVCKGLKAELLGDVKKNKKEVQRMPLFNHALLTIIRLRPEKNEQWTLSIKCAKYCFSLQIDTMLKHCAALPVEDEFHLTDREIGRFKGGYTSGYIRFIDAFNLASRIGMKIVMQRRHLFETKIMESAVAILAALGGNIKQPRLNVKEAIVQLKITLATLRKDVVGKKKVSGESELLKGIRLLGLLLTDFGSLHWKLVIINHAIRPTTKRNYLSIESVVSEIKCQKKSIVERYKKHRSFCPGVMKTDCLALLE